MSITVDMKAGEPVASNPLLLKLEELNLEQYTSALADQGYDSMASFKGLTKEEAEAIADDVKMQPGHKKLFVKGFA